ncbi:SDR family oxidoreductase [Micromonospora sonneratiae]|uniref:SDR family NAD(P)-dependent oxidoreductase n=1 Tax=Micromonospora sonneratiae TaxID=1184706 RepID=A0ABW3YH78_9ACTN
MRALVTGATSGIGLALARRLAAGGYDLVLVARDGDRLATTAAELHATHRVAGEVLAADLTTEAGLTAVEARLTQETDPVDVLVNNAGMGLPPGGYLGNPVQTSLTLNRLNVDSVLRLTHVALPGMLARRRGGLITISSIAGFVPGTPAITYSASKAWTTAFGEGLHQLLRGTGVTSTTVVPGFVRSEFHQRSGASTAGLPDWLWSTPQTVAETAVRGFDRAAPLVVPGTVWRTGYGISRLLPRRWSRAAFARLMSRTARSTSRKGADR